MTDSQGFWSYVHKDDEADGDRIVQLAHDIVAQYEMLTGETIELFLDRDDLTWGVEWEARINASLATVAFFIPVLTPRYFASTVCLKELNTFARRASDLGVEQLLLPILYMNIPGLDDDEPSDDAIALVKRFQWVDWRELRFTDRASPEYRKAVAGLAQRLVEANRAAESADVAEKVSDAALDDDDDDDDDDGGWVEKLAEFESALPALNETANGIGEAIVEVGEIMTLASTEVNTPGGNASFARRLQLLRQLAAELAEPSKRIAKLGDDFSSQLHDVDLGVRAIIERAPDEPENREDFCSFFESIRGMVHAAEEGLGAIQGMSDAAAPLEKLSRDIRPPLRDMRKGLTRMAEGRAVMGPWLALIDKSGVDCGTGGEAAD